MQHYLAKTWLATACLVFLSAAGLAAELNCSPVNNWVISDDRVVCQSRTFAITGTITINGSSNVTFLGSTNITTMAVYDSANFTLNNASFSALNAYNTSLINIQNASIIQYSAANFHNNSIVTINYSTITPASPFISVSFQGRNATIHNSVIGSSGSYAGVQFLAGNVTILNSTITAHADQPTYLSSFLNFSGDTVASIRDSSLYVAAAQENVFSGNTMVNMTNSTFFGLHLTTKSNQMLELNNITLSKDSNRTGHIKIGNARAYFFNSSVNSVIINANESTNITYSEINHSNSNNFYSNSIVTINYSNTTPASQFISSSFQGRNTTIHNSIVGSTAYMAGVQFLAGNVTILNSTITAYADQPTYLSSFLNFSGDTVASIKDSSLYAAAAQDNVFSGNTMVNMTNSTFFGLHLTTKSNQMLELNNITLSKDSNRTGHIKIGNARAYFFNSSVNSVIINANESTNITYSEINHSNSNNFYGNSIVTINYSTITPASQFISVSFQGRNTTIHNSVIGSSGSYAGVQFLAGNVTILNSTITAYSDNPGYSSSFLNFSGDTVASIKDSALSSSNYGIQFMHTAIVNATNTTLSGGTSFSGDVVLYRKNYFKLFVNDSAGRALRNVSVVAYNTTSGEYDFVGSTDAFGWLNTSLLWYKQNATQAYNVSLTVNVSGAGLELVNQSEYNMSVDRFWNTTFAGAYGNVLAFPGVAGGFNANVTVHAGNESMRPWNGSRQVELRSGVATVVANFSWNFSAGDLNLSNITITRSDADRYVGINGTNVTPLMTTVWVPVWGKECNVRVCAGKANYSHCAAGDWVQASSVQSGEYCVLAVNGTVVQDRPTAVTTKMVIKVPGWDAPLAGALFAFALLVFVLRGTARPARTARRIK